LFELDGDPSDAILGGTCSLKIEFRFLNGYLIVPGGPSAYLLVDDQRQPIKPLEVLMKRYLGVVAAAALLVRGVNDSQAQRRGALDDDLAIGVEDRRRRNA
jgi:hypothetical protein